MRPWGAAARAWTTLGALIAGMAVGAHAGRVWDPAWVFGAGVAGTTLGAAVVLLVTATATRRTIARGALLLAVAMAGAAWWSLRIGADAGATGPMPDDGAVVRLEGVVQTRPRHMEGPGAGVIGIGAMTTFMMHVDRDATPGLSGARGDVVRVVYTGRMDAAVKPGDRVAFAATLDPIGPAPNPGQRDPRIRAAQDGLIGVAHTSGSLVANLGSEPGPGAWLLRVRGMLRERALAAMDGKAGDDTTEKNGSSRGVALARSLVLGEDEAALEPAREAFTRVGLSHVLAISGFHLVVLVWSVLVMVRLFGDRGVLEPLVVAGLVVLYLLIVPAEAPVLRAGVMALAFLGADALGRRHDRLAVLGWIACGLVLWRPADAFALGFQLSVGLTGVLLWMGTRTNDRLWGARLKGTVTTPDPTVWSMATSAAKSMVSASLLCWMAGLALIAWHTGSVSLLAIPATMIVVPLCVMMMWLGFIAMLGGLVRPRIGEAMGVPLESLGSAVTDVVLWFDESPLSLVRVAPFSALLAGACAALAMWWCHSGRWRSGPHWLATAMVACWGAMELSQSQSLASDVGVRIDTLSVGDGACHLVRSGDAAMLWDCGSLARDDVGARTLPRAARSLGVTHVPLAVLTHPNLDHYNGLLDAARTMGVRTLLVGDATLDAVRREPRSRLAVAMLEMERRGVEVRRVGAGDWLEFGEARVRFIWPRDAFESHEPNERSLVAEVGARDGSGGSLLLTGDIQAEAIEGIMRAQRDGEARRRVAAMELPHHGSAIRESLALVYEVDPRAVHQSTGPRRGTAYWEDQMAGRWWGVTARDGAVWTEILRNGTTRSGSMR